MEYLCDFGNCPERQDGKRMITITNNVNGDRRRFCGWLHAAEYCRTRFELGFQPISEEDLARLARKAEEGLSRLARKEEG